MGYLPLHFKISGVKFLFIGGGKVNERRIKKILSIEPKADIIVVSPWITETLAELVKKGEIKWIARAFGEDILDEDYRFVFVGVDKGAEEIVSILKNKGYLMENASCGKSGDFIFPAIIEHKNIVVSISTSGEDPSLTKAIKEKIENCLKKLIE